MSNQSHHDQSSSEPETGLDPQDEAIAELLASDYSHKEIAEHLKISTKTIQRRLQNPTFKAVMLKQQRGVLSQSTSMLVGMTPDAINTLAALIASDNENIQLRAVAMALSQGRRFHDQEMFAEELEARVTRLEQAFEDEELGMGQ